MNTNKPEAGSEYTQEQRLQFWAGLERDGLADKIYRCSVPRPDPLPLMKRPDATDKAALLITEIEAALARGTEHYAIDGRPLRTTREILEALAKDGQITFAPQPRPSGWVNALTGKPIMLNDPANGSACPKCGEHSIISDAPAEERCLNCGWHND